VNSATGDSTKDFRPKVCDPSNQHISRLARARATAKREKE
jgi:hypothetical protein